MFIYLYALANRPFGIGTAPGDCLQVTPRPSPGEPHHDVARHGIAVYPRELTPEEVKTFELPLLLDARLLPRLAALISDEMAEYAKGYLEMCEDSPENFADHVRRAARDLWPGYPPSVEDPAALQHMVRMNLARHVDAQLDTRIQALTELKTEIAGSLCEGEQLSLSPKG
jgi:hypothetical protein